MINPSDRDGLMLTGTRSGSLDVLRGAPRRDSLESREVLGGFWIVHAGDAEVEGLARETAKACRTTIEVRPLEDDPAG